MNLSRVLRRWDVYHVARCRHAKPKPKNKFVVVVCADSPTLGFFINSEARPLYAKWHLRIAAERNRFLSRDSFVDCHEVFEFNAEELHDRRGELESAAPRRILNAACDCPQIKDKHKRRMGCPRSKPKIPA